MRVRHAAKCTLVLVIFAMAARCVAGEREAVVRLGGCTAFVVEGDLLVTAKHCRHPETVQVSVQGKTVTATRVYVCPGEDGPVVFHLQGGPYEGLPVAGRVPQTGDAVYSLGYPGGNWARIEGILKGGNGGDVNYTNHRIATGNSGGPLLNADGEVIGVALHVASDIAVHESGFAGWRVTTEAIRAAQARRPYAGWVPIRPRQRDGPRPVVVVFASERCGPCGQLKRDVRAGHFDDYEFVFVYWDEARRQWSDPDAYRRFQETCKPSRGTLAFPTIWVQGTDQYRVGYAADRRGGLLGWLRSVVRNLLEGLIGRRERRNFPESPPFPEQENFPRPEDEPSESGGLVQKLRADLDALRDEARRTKSELDHFKEAGVVGKIRALARLRSEKDEALERVEAVRADLRAIRERFKTSPLQFLWSLFGLLSGLVHRRFAH